MTPGAGGREGCGLGPSAAPVFPGSLSVGGFSSSLPLLPRSSPAPVFGQGREAQQKQAQCPAQREPAVPRPEQGGPRGVGVRRHQCGHQHHCQHPPDCHRYGVREGGPGSGCRAVCSQVQAGPGTGVPLPGAPGTCAHFLCLRPRPQDLVPLRGQTATVVQQPVLFEHLPPALGSAPSGASPHTCVRWELGFPPRSLIETEAGLGGTPCLASLH